MPRRYSEQQFRTAVQDPDVRTMADLCRALGIVPRGGNYESVRAYASELAIDLDRHLRPPSSQRSGVATGTRRSYTDVELLAAFEQADGYPAVCAALGLSPVAGTYARLRARVSSLGFEVPEDWSRPGRRSALGRVADLRTGTGGTTSSVHVEDDDYRSAVLVASCYADAIRALGQRPNSAAYGRLRRAIRRLGLDTSHFDPRMMQGGKRQRPVEDLLTSGAAHTASIGLGSRLIAEGLKAHRCEICGLTRWRDRPIPLELDHINGDRTDNRLDNLRLLCPNCHAQTPTYRGRNIGRWREGGANDTGDGDIEAADPSTSGSSHPWSS